MNIPLFDGHCDALYKLMATPDQHLTDSDGQWSLHRCQQFAPQAQIFAVFADSAQPDANAQAAWQIQRMHQECALAPDRIALCTTGTQAKEAVAAGKLAAFLSVEGAELLDCSLEPSAGHRGRACASSTPPGTTPTPWLAAIATSRNEG